MIRFNIKNISLIWVSARVEQSPKPDKRDNFGIEGALLKKTVIALIVVGVARGGKANGSWLETLDI